MLNGLQAYQQHYGGCFYLKKSANEKERKLEERTVLDDKGSVSYTAYCTEDEYKTLQHNPPILRKGHKNSTFCLEQVSVVNKGANSTQAEFILFSPLMAYGSEKNVGFINQGYFYLFYKGKLVNEYVLEGNHDVKFRRTLSTESDLTDDDIGFSGRGILAFAKIDGKWVKEQHIIYRREKLTEDELKVMDLRWLAKSATEVDAQKCVAALNGMSDPENGYFSLNDYITPLGGFSFYFEESSYFEYLNKNVAGLYSRLPLLRVSVIPDDRKTPWLDTKAINEESIQAEIARSRSESVELPSIKPSLKERIVGKHPLENNGSRLTIANNESGNSLSGLSALWNKLDFSIIKSANASMSGNWYNFPYAQNGAVVSASGYISWELNQGNTNLEEISNNASKIVRGVGAFDPANEYIKGWVYSPFDFVPMMFGYPAGGTAIKTATYAFTSGAMLNGAKQFLSKPFPEFNVNEMLLTGAVDASVPLVLKQIPKLFNGAKGATGRVATNTVESGTTNVYRRTARQSEIG